MGKGMQKRRDDSKGIQMRINQKLIVPHHIDTYTCCYSPKKSNNITLSPIF